MDEKNKEQLVTLAATCHRSGILPIFLGVLIGFIGLINKDVSTVLAGLFVFIVGYAFIKIAKKIRTIISDLG